MLAPTHYTPRQDNSRTSIIICAFDDHVVSWINPGTIRFVNETVG